MEIWTPNQVVMPRDSKIAAREEMEARQAISIASSPDAWGKAKNE